MNWREIKSGDEYIHNVHGRVQALDFLPNSYTKLTVRETDRGIGWDERSQSYKGVSTKDGQGWSLGKNYSYNAEHVVHVKDLTQKQ